MVIAAFPPGEKYAVNYTALDQYDYGQILRIQELKLPKTVEVHFSTQETGGTSITRVGVTKDGVTDVLIPDSVLENGDTTQNYSIFAFVYVTDATSGKTEYRARLEVKARSKPEVPGGGDSPDVFHEAVLEVRKSAEKAEEAQRQAEGWAHGREDLPERAEDNAKHYSDKASEDAKKTAEDRKEVERVAESVKDITEQVDKVEKLSKNAQEAATQAGTSAEQAELHKQAAETASSAAQTAAQETEADRTSVEKTKETVENLSAQVQKNKESVDKTAQDFALNAQQAIADVNNSGQTQTERVQTAGTTAVENIKNAQNMATQAVETAKSEAIKAVQAEGTKQTGAVTAEGERQVQAVQTATQEIIADREQITKNKTDIADLRQNKADAIVENVRGTLLNVKDSANAFFEDFSVYGKSEQVQTTGKNILPYSVELGAYSANTPDKIDIDADNTRCRIAEPIQINDGFNGIISIFGSYQIFVRLFKNNKFVTESGFLTNYKLDNTLNKFDLLTVVIRKPDDIAFSRDEFKRVKIQLEKGTTATAYEPYTGGKPSPSPEYPQEIVNAGRLNEDTGKYEIDVKVTGKNIVNIPDISADTPGGTILCRIVDNAVVSAQEKAVASSDVWHICFYSKDGKKQYFNGTETHKAITATPKNPIIKLEYRNVYITSGAYKGIMVEYGTVATKYEPYKEQTLTLTSDRPLTKWDRLTEQDGQIGWLYNTGEIMLSEIALWSVQKDNLPDNRTQRIYAILDNAIKNRHCYATKYYSEEPSVSLIKHKDYECITICNGNYLTLKVDRNIGTTSEDYVNYFGENDDKVIYNSTEQEFVPLPQPEQNAIRALKTYYPTTVVSNSEDAEMQLTYVADTKNYTDRKIEEAVSAQTQNLANLLSLMPLSTQAAMIENDTNNILNMEVQK